MNDRHAQVIAIIERFGKASPEHLARFLNMFGACSWCPVDPQRKRKPLPCPNVPKKSLSICSELLDDLFCAGLLVRDTVKPNNKSVYSLRRASTVDV